MGNEGQLSMFPNEEVQVTDDEERQEEIYDALVECMPLDSMFIDLWDWGIHFERDLESDWFDEAARGVPETLDECAATLAEYFLECVDQYDMDYDQQNDPDGFSLRVHDHAKKFVTAWRSNIQRQNPIES